MTFKRCLSSSPINNLITCMRKSKISKFLHEVYWDAKHRVEKETQRHSRLSGIKQERNFNKFFGGVRGLPFNNFP